MDFGTSESGRVYAPGVRVLDGRCHICFAADTRHGIRAGIAVTDDFDRFDICSLTMADNRDLVLFPKRDGCVSSTQWTWTHVECMAAAHVDNLIALCTDPPDLDALAAPP